MSNRYLSLAVFLALVAAAAAFAAAFPAGEWYFETMNQPDWIPPPWLFGPVWSVLYVMMAIAAWLVWETGHRMRNGAIAWWLIQLALNAIWSWLFFGIHRVGFALLEMTILIGVLVMCIQAFRGVSGRAALLLLPYLAWLLFAWVLNLTIWLMNGGGLGSIIG
jgi:tryptophan-rich sensory protein